MSTSTKIELFRETRMWLTGVIVPIIIIGTVAANNPQVRYTVNNIKNNIKNKVSSVFKKNKTN